MEEHSAIEIDLQEPRLTENAHAVLERRYLHKGEDGAPVETVKEMFHRVARTVAAVDVDFGQDARRTTQDFYDLLTNLRFLPNSPTFTGAGTPLGQLAACFTEDMRVSTVSGPKRIADLRVGDLVLTHKGRLRPVTELYQRRYKGKLLRIKVKLIGTELEVTPEHPILTPEGWVRAGDLQVGDEVAVGVPTTVHNAPVFDLAELPYERDLEVRVEQDAVSVRRPSEYQNSGVYGRSHNRFIEVTPELARLCGYYVAEGTIGPDIEYVRFTFGNDERDYYGDTIQLIETVFGCEPNCSYSNHGEWMNVNLYGRAIATWFQKQFGRGATGKHLPPWLQYAKREIQREFIVGLFRGDGFYSENEYTPPSNPTDKPKTVRAFRLTLANPGLIRQVWQMLLRLGYDAAVRPVDTSYVTANASPASQISMPPLSSRDLVQQMYNVKLPEPDQRYVRTFVRRDGEERILFRIEEIERVDFSGIVYNCEVEEDHTYVTEGIVVHNCFVLPIEDDMGRDPAGIFSTLRNAALIQQTGGGNGFSFSRLRPKDARVSTSGGIASGPVSFLKMYDAAFGAVHQGGVRRGANMAVLRVDHPDVREFIRCKAHEGDLANFNISVGITDEFMRAVENDEDFDLVNPQDGSVWETVRARDLFDELVQHAHHNGEPGVLFLDTANRSNPVPHLYELEATNPCVTGDTLIYTATGLRRAREVAAKQQPISVVVDGRFSHAGPDYGSQALRDHVETLQPASHVFPTGMKDVYRVTTHEGYELRLTANHKVMTPNGWVEARNLRPDDEVYILNRPGAFGTEGTKELGLVLGWLVGDGTVNQVRAVLSFFGEEKAEIAPTMAQAVTAVVDVDRTYSSHPTRNYPVGLTEIAERDEVRIQSDRLGLLAAEYGLDEEKLQVPDVVFKGTETMQLAFLQALFTADGTVLDGGAKGGSVRLTSVRYGLLQDVQRLLLNFGIASRIYRERRSAGMRQLPDGQGGYAEYHCQTYHELAISKDNLLRFAERIGFLSNAKQGALVDYLDRLMRGPYRERFIARVAEVEYDGKEIVYDLSQPTTNSFVANGIVVHNCGEQWLGPYENCCLGSINLAQHVTEQGDIDWEKLRDTIERATHFLDNVVSANKYVPAVPELEKAAHTARRIGLGIMGLADMMYHAGVRYGSADGEELAAQVMEFVRFHSMKTSIEMARRRGPFPAIKGSIYDPNHLKWKPPTPLTPYERDFGRPALDWNEIVEGIERYGIRNAAQTTIAPTGTIATVAGCEGYGCEPVFALAYIRHVQDGEEEMDLQYTSPLFEKALIEAGVDEQTRQAIYDEVMRTGTCQHIEAVPEHLRRTFVVASDIMPEEHVRMQAALQAFVDASISKTINFPEAATPDDVAKAYTLAWELGCKGLTVYVTGTREKVVLETQETQEAKSNPPSSQPSSRQAKEDSPSQIKKPRPRKLRGFTYKQVTPLGTAYVNVTEDKEGHPFEVFLNVGKGGSDTAAAAEAIGRLISLVLRLPSPRSPEERLREVIAELSDIGGGRTLGFGADRVSSLPDGVAQALAEHLGQPEVPAPPLSENPGGNGAAARFTDDYCPECGQATLVREEGCRKCYTCGFSEC